VALTFLEADPALASPEAYPALMLALESEWALVLEWAWALESAWMSALEWVWETALASLEAVWVLVSESTWTSLETRKDLALRSWVVLTSGVS
jgi:adenine-specific DNA methylase